MAALNPPQFTFPPIRYSPIQEAFRGALDIGMSELFQLPFQKLAQKRELQKYAQERGIEAATEINYAPAKALATRQAEINTGQVIPESSLDAETRANLVRAGAAPKYAMGTESYYAPESLTQARRYSLPVQPAIQTYLDDARRRMNLPGVGTPVTEGQLPELATAMGVELPVAQYQKQSQQFEELRVDQLIQSLSTPGPEFLDFSQRIAFEQDPTHPGHLTRNFEDIFKYSKMPQYMQALRNPVLQRPENAAYRKQIESDLARAQQLAPLVRYPSAFFPTKEDMDRRLGGVRSASPSAAITSDVAILARIAAENGWLEDPSRPGKRIAIVGNANDMSRAITALQHNSVLLEAMVYATAYGTNDNMQWGGRLGNPFPTNKMVRDLLQNQIFPTLERGANLPGGFQNVPGRPGYSPSAAPGEAGEGPAANQFTPATPGQKSSALLVPAGQAEVLNQGKPSAGTAAVNQVGMSEGARALYQAVHDKARANPQAFAETRAVIDSLSSGPPEHVISQLKQLASDTTFVLDPDGRNKLILAVHNIERMPPAKRAAYLAQLRWMLIQMSVQGREDALGALTNPTAAAEATGTKKPEEKKQE